MVGSFITVRHLGKSKDIFDLRLTLDITTSDILGQRMCCFLTEVSILKFYVHYPLFKLETFKYYTIRVDKTKCL